MPAADLTFELRSAESVEPIEALDSTRWSFRFLCCYLASQAYLIPVLAVGPNWSLWPRLADIAGGLMLVGVILNLPRLSALPTIHRRIFDGLVVMSWYAVLSFLGLSLLLSMLVLQLAADRAVLWGCYELLRLFQFVTIFYAASYIPITPERRKVLAQITTAVLVVLCASVVVTYFGIVPYEALVAHLPDEPARSGPWAFFGENGDGVGTVSYNHAYTALQVIMVFVFLMFLTDSRFSLTNLGLLVASAVAVFLSGSRAGLGGMLVLAAGCGWMWLRQGHLKPILGAAAAGAFAAIVGLWVATFGAVTVAPTKSLEGESIVSRQLTTFAGYRSENLAGRTDIWASRIEFLNESPHRWLVGSGYGSAIASGKMAHMMALNVIIETGIIGLAICCYVMSLVLYGLWQMGPPGRPLLWGTIVLLVTSLTQDTFYPVPAMGHFPALYLLMVAVGLRWSFDCGVSAEHSAEQGVPHLAAG